jgi:hypothetical protein
MENANDLRNIERMKDAENADLVKKISRLLKFASEFSENYHKLHDGEYWADETRNKEEFTIIKTNFRRSQESTPVRINTKTKFIEVQNDLNMSNHTLIFMIMNVWLFCYYEHDFFKADRKAFEIMVMFHNFSRRELLHEIKPILLDEKNGKDIELNTKRFNKITELQF